MLLTNLDAEAILSAMLGDPIKPPTKYVVGFCTPTGKPLAMHRTASTARIWFRPPAPPAIAGVHLIAPSNGNSNLTGPLSPLGASGTLRVEIASATALRRFIDWYLD